VPPQWPCQRTAGLAKFDPGHTTYNEIVAALGTPTVTETGQDGSRKIAYSYTRVTTSPATFIPIVDMQRLVGAGSGA
jgi:hypothetical protein